MYFLIVSVHLCGVVVKTWESYEVVTPSIEKRGLERKELTVVI